MKVSSDTFLKREHALGYNKGDTEELKGPQFRLQDSLTYSFGVSQRRLF
jgi:hypothetical protein